MKTPGLWARIRFRLARIELSAQDKAMIGAAPSVVIPAVEEAVTPTETVRLPIQAYVSVIAVACLPLGMLWDISWHISIGRDTFWAPAHITMQIGGIVPALMFAWQAWRTTFYGTPAERGASVSFFGARASLGA